MRVKFWIITLGCFCWGQFSIRGGGGGEGGQSSVRQFFGEVRFPGGDLLGKVFREIIFQGCFSLSSERIQYEKTT